MSTEEVKDSKVRTGKTRGTPFEFYRVFDHSHKTGHGKQIERCTPSTQRTTIKNLSKVCAKFYGAGSFVALEIGENEGLPLSHWVIKVESGMFPVHKEVPFNDEQLFAIRQVYFPQLTKIENEIVGTIAFDDPVPYSAAGLSELYKIANIDLDRDAIQRGNEAAHAAQYLNLLPNPKKKRRRWKEIAKKRRGRPPDPIVDWMRKRTEEEASQKDIVPEAMEKFVLTHEQAETKYRSSQRSGQKQRQKKAKN